MTVRVRPAAPQNTKPLRLVQTNIGVGSRIEFVEMENGQFAIVPSVSPIQSLKGMIRKPTTPVSIEQMNMAIAQRAAHAK